MTAQLIASRPRHRVARYDAIVVESEVDIVDGTTVAFCRGDESGLKAAYDAHGSLIYTLCRRTLPDDRAADVTQEVFVSAWKARSQFDPSKGSLAAWLTGIAKNRIIDNIRSEKRHEDRRSEASAAELAGPSEVEHTADKMLVAQALSVLPPRQRSIIELAYLKGLTHAEISDTTGVALGTVKSDIRRGLEQIRRHLGGGT